MKAPLWVAMGCIGIGLSAGSAAAGGSQPGTATGWQYIVEPYLMVPSLSGSSGVHGQIADVNVTASDIFSHLHFGAMLYFEARDPHWAVSLDGLYMDLGQSGSIRSVIVDVGIKQTLITLTGYRRIVPWAEASVGLTFNEIQGSLTASGPQGLDESATESWVDPSIGVRLTLPNTVKWRLMFTGSIGGFGAGSDFAWQVYPEIGYRFTPLFELAGGYRAISMDYSNGSGGDEFVYDLTTSGPQLGAMFHF